MIYSQIRSEFETINGLDEKTKELLPHVNCCERILRCSDTVLELSLSDDVFVLAQVFGGGMKIESVCGALTGSIMTLSKYFVNHDLLNEIIVDYFNMFNNEYKVMNCNELKDRYYDDVYGCQNVMLKAAKVLDRTVLKYTQSEVIDEQ